MATRGERNPWDVFDDEYAQQAAGMPMLGGGRGGMPTSFPQPQQRLPTQTAGPALGPPKFRQTEHQFVLGGGNMTGGGSLLDMLGSFGTNDAGDVVWNQQQGGGISPPPSIAPPSVSPPKVDTYTPTVDTIPKQLLQTANGVWYTPGPAGQVPRESGYNWTANEWNPSGITDWYAGLANQINGGTMTRPEAMRLREMQLQERQDRINNRSNGGMSGSRVTGG